jgi:radical SAM superfamily enzyme YgiQ (UPF0313 family)
LRVRDKSKLNLIFTGYNRIDLIARKPEQISLLNELNFNGMFFGIESMNHQAAKFIGKGCKPEEITETLYKLKDTFGKKLLATGGFIIGLPYDTPETVEAWTRDILTEDYPLNHYVFTPLAMTANASTVSVFSKEKEKYGFRKMENNSQMHTWKNDIWDFDICDALSKKYRGEVSKLGKKISSFTAMAMMKYGYTWEQATELKIKDINDNSMIVKHQKYIDDYVIRLLNYLGINSNTE